MSSSIFKEYVSSNTLNDEEGDPNLKSDPNLVILVNKSGKVSVDERTLHSLLTNEVTETSVTIVRVTSPTPSMQEEMDEEEKHRISDMELLETLDESDASIKNEIVSPRVGITIENYYSPKEAKTFVTEVLSLVGIDNPVGVDFEFQRYAIQNDHCYTNIISPQKQKPVPTKKAKPSPSSVTIQKVSESANDVSAVLDIAQRKSSVKVLELSTNDESLQIENEEKIDSSTSDLQNILEESNSEYSEESETPSESDNESDLDYNLSQGNTIPKITKKKRKKKKKNTLKPLRECKKRKSNDGDVEAMLAELDSNKKVKKSAIKRKITTNTRRIPSKGKQIPEMKAPEPDTSIEKKTNITIKASTSKLQPVKKEKKSSAHMDALFSDMSSLFSKPDKIKTIEPPKPPSTNPNKEFVSFSQNSKLPGTITVQTHTSRSFEMQTEQLDFIDSIVKEELKSKGEGKSEINENRSNQEVDLPDNSLLESLSEALPEDFLQHVAELAENKELQEIIDKQVLGVNDPISTSIPVIPITEASNLTTVTTPTLKSCGRQVIRPDGRVITLPPIEMPTTRAKRRAQNTSDSFSDLDTTSSTFVAKLSQTPALGTKEVDNAKKISSREQPKEKSTSRRSSVNSSNASVRRDSNASSSKKSDGRKRKPNPAVLAVLNDDEDFESDESWNSEDDPDRLWCICKQPHNNRFMICCDSCEEWFHGKCVNVTKAMGKEMEASGKDWTCPTCVNKKKEREQAKITNFFHEPQHETNNLVTVKSPKIKSSPVTPATSSVLSTPSHISNTKKDIGNCIVCKKVSRSNSVYCSDDCILKHAQNALTSTKTVSAVKINPSVNDEGDFDNKIQMSKILKNQDDHVTVFEKTSGIILTGKQAPTVHNLRQWLKEHPTFQVKHPHQPETTNQAFLAKKQQLKEVAKKIKSQDPISVTKAISTQPAKIQTKLKFESQPKNLVINSPNTNKINTTPSTSKQIQRKSVDGKSTVNQKPEASLNKSSTQSKSTEKPKIKKQSTLGQSWVSTPENSKATDQLRKGVKKQLKELLIARTKELTDSKAPRLTDEAIESFCNEVENEMFEYFNKDTGQKYKAKYRSLMFNIKDRKNLTLFQKISEKAVTPARLVRMEPQELASQELAKWRENESKHQLEMIKKSELELLACSKNYVLKTHKGEEIVEDHVTDRLELDPSVAVEDVVSILNNSNNVTSTTKENLPAKQPESEDKYVKSYTHGDAHSSKKKDSKRRSRSRSRDRRSKHKHRRNSRSRDRRDHSRGREKRTHIHDDNHDKKKHEHRSFEKKHEKHDRSRSTKQKDEKQVDDYNLVDKILEASQAIVSSGRLDVEKIAKEQEASEKKNQQTVESDQEPTSTVTISTPPHSSSPAETLTSCWSGGIKMIDVASFKIEMQPVSGDIESVLRYFPKVLDVVGRIAPETVYEYIGKVKKIPNREIIIVRFSSPNTVAYTTMFKYHEQRRRFGVIKTSGVLKDFYLLTLPAARKLPSVLMPINGVGFVDGDHKPDLLIGVIVKLNGVKRPASDHKERISKAEVLLLPPIITKKSLENIDPTYSVSDERYTPPNSPKRKKTKSLLSLGLPKAESSSTANDDDEPYSPGGSDCEGAITSVTTTTTLTLTVEEDVNKKVDEINRQIEARKLEIASMIGADPDDLGEPYSPSRVTSPPCSSALRDKSQPSLFGLDKLENIAIPSNLSEILASIKGVSAANFANATGMNMNEEYDPTATVTVNKKQYTQLNTSSYNISYASTNDQPTTTNSADNGSSKLSRMTDEELLLIAGLNEKATESKEPMDVDDNDDDIFEIPDEDEGIK